MMNQIAILESLVKVLKEQMAIIEQQANDLRCCGNCKKYTENRNLQHASGIVLP